MRLKLRQRRAACAAAAEDKRVGDSERRPRATREIYLHPNEGTPIPSETRVGKAPRKKERKQTQRPRPSKNPQRTQRGYKKKRRRRRRRASPAALFVAQQRVLDALLEASVMARSLCDARETAAVRISAGAVVKVAVRAREDARRSVEAALLGDDTPDDGQLASLACALRRRCLALGAREFRAEDARRGCAERDDRCVAWLARLCERAEARERLEELVPLLHLSRVTERSLAFQKALLLDQLRLASRGAHDRGALAYGTTPFASFARVLAHASLATQRARCCDPADTKRLVVLGASRRSPSSLYLFFSFSFSRSCA